MSPHMNRSYVRVIATIAWAGVSLDPASSRSAVASHPRTGAINPVSIIRNIATVDAAIAAPAESPCATSTACSSSHADTDASKSPLP